MSLRADCRARARELSPPRIEALREKRYSALTYFLYTRWRSSSEGGRLPRVASTELHKVCCSTDTTHNGSRHRESLGRPCMRANPGPVTCPENNRGVRNLINARPSSARARPVPGHLFPRACFHQRRQIVIRSPGQHWRERIIVSAGIIDAPSQLKSRNKQRSYQT